MVDENEDSLIERCTALWPKRPAGGIGPGDDCAVWSPPPSGWVSVAKVDAVVEGHHFRPVDAPRRVGHKALARCLSDFAAMGAVPEHVLVTVAFPFRKRRATPWLEACYRGMGALARRYDLSLAGGELTGSDAIWLNISLHGRVRSGKAVQRSGGSPGDLLFVTGKLGGSFPSRHLKFTPRVEEGQWLAAFGVRAMMDLSDGLGKDLPRLARASQCAFAIEPDRLPRQRGCTIHQAVNDGEDYGLLFAVSPGKEKSLRDTWPFPIPLTRIGELLSPEMNPVTGGVAFSGWDHLIRH